jgi:hypothetical protein
MAITAQFDADFSAFSAEVGKASQQLTGFEAQTTKTGTAIVGMGTVTTKTTPALTAMSASIQQFDGILNAVGIHVGPAVKGLQELGQASGQTARELGLFTTAGLAVGAAMAGWKIGRAIADFFGLDQAIANTTARLMGWGDLVGQTAGAKADVLALATQRAGREITNFSEALQINQKWVDAHKKGAVENAKALEEFAKAQEAVRIAGQDWGAVLKTIAPSTVAAAKAALDHGVAQNTVATAYKLTAPQIAAVESALKAEQEAMKASEKEHARITAELKTHWDAVLAIRDQALGKDAVEKATQWTEALFLLGGTLDKLSHAQLVDLQAAMTEAMTAMARNGNLTDEQAAQFNNFAATAANVAAALRPVQQEATATAVAFEAMKAPAEEAAAAIASVHDQIAAMQGIGTKLPGSSETMAFGNRYLVSPTGQRVPLGPHGELPGNWFEQYTGQSAFNEAYSPLLNSGRILAGGQRSNVVQVNSGAVQMMFPVMNDPAAMNQLAGVVGAAIMSKITRTGTVV